MDQLAISISTAAEALLRFPDRLAGPGGPIVLLNRKTSEAVGQHGAGRPFGPHLTDRVGAYCVFGRLPVGPRRSRQQSKGAHPARTNTRRLDVRRSFSLSVV